MSFPKYLLFVFLFFFLSCSSSKKFQRTLPKQIQESQTFGRAFTGFALYNIDSEEFIQEVNTNLYFTPASNTKILTLFTALQILGDSIAALRYEIKGDSLIFCGTGDPTFLNPYLKQSDNAYSFLKNQKGKLFFYHNNYEDKRFGEGWMWDDFPYSFQPEKSSFPIYSNLITFIGDPINGGFKTHPKFFEKYLSYDENLKSEYPRIRRNEFDNYFNFNDKAVNSNTPFKRERPFLFSPEVFVELLQDTLKREVKLLNINDLLFGENRKTIKNATLPLYKELMIESDNFIAEQLLLAASEKVFGIMNTGKIIQFAKDSLMQGIPDEPLWEDGSGLTRYNLFTPRSLVWLLEKLYHQMPEERLFEIFPAGGVSGTIENWYGAEESYVFAKTGTLRNNHCLSGYIKTKSGKTLIFSFMNNNFQGGSKPFKEEMQEFLRRIYENY